MEKVFKTQLAGRELIVETGKYAQQAGGSCIVRCGDTAVLVCATASEEPRQGIDLKKNCTPLAKFPVGSSNGKGARVKKQF